MTPAAPATATPSSSAPDEPRFVPGTVLDGRYRIVGLLGRGLVLLRVMVRSSWGALAVFVALFTVLNWPAADPVIFGILANVTIWTAFGLCMMRFGLVAFIAAAFISILLSKPVTLELTAWYAGSALTMLAAAVAFILAAFHVSLGGRPLFSEDA